MPAERVEVRVEGPMVAVLDVSRGIVARRLVGRDALVYEAGKWKLEMLWVAGYRHDSPDFDVKAQTFRLSDSEREWLRLRALDASTPSVEGPP